MPTASWKPAASGRRASRPACFPAPGLSVRAYGGPAARRLPRVDAGRRSRATVLSVGPRPEAGFERSPCGVGLGATRWGRQSSHVPAVHQGRNPHPRNASPNGVADVLRDQTVIRQRQSPQERPAGGHSGPRYRTMMSAAPARRDDRVLMRCSLSVARAASPVPVGEFPGGHHADHVFATEPKPKWRVPLPRVSENAAVVNGLAQGR